MKVITRELVSRRRQCPRSEGYQDLDRGLNAALERLTGETPKDRQRAFGRKARRASPAPPPL